MRLIFTRHGESEANAAGIFSNRGWMHPLTDAGRHAIEQAAPGHVDTVRQLFFAGLPPELVAPLAAALEKVNDHLRSLP